MDTLQNEIISFSVIALVIIALAVMTKKRENDFKEFDNIEDREENN